MSGGMAMMEAMAETRQGMAGAIREDNSSWSQDREYFGPVRWMIERNFVAMTLDCWGCGRYMQRHSDKTLEILGARRDSYH